MKNIKEYECDVSHILHDYSYLSTQMDFNLDWLPCIWYHKGELGYSFNRQATPKLVKQQRVGC